MMKKFPLFHYNTEDYNFIINTDNRNSNKSDNNSSDSKFDKLLKAKWQESMELGILRYKLCIKNWKWLDGKYKFLVQLNTDRAENRRKPEDIDTISASFNPERFNFTKIIDSEIYFDINNGDGNNVIACNVSPIEYGHCLFLPDRLKCLPQRVTKFSLFKIVEFLLISKSPYLRAVFNGLCAYASVNHLHWHLYYLNYPMLLEEIVLECITEPVYTINDYPAHGFCIKLSSFPINNIQKFITSAYKLINYLQEQLIAHNVYVTRAKTHSDILNYNDIRIYIWARRACTGVKDTNAFIPAVCELFGHILIRNEDEFNKLNEADVVQCLEDVTRDSFVLVKEKLKNINFNL